MGVSVRLYREGVGRGVRGGGRGLGDGVRGWDWGLSTALLSASLMSAVLIQGTEKCCIAVTTPRMIRAIDYCYNKEMFKYYQRGISEYCKRGISKYCEREISN